MHGVHYLLFNSYVRRYAWIHCLAVLVEEDILVARRYALVHCLAVLVEENILVARRRYA